MNTGLLWTSTWIQLFVNQLPPGSKSGSFKFQITLYLSQYCAFTNCFQGKQN